jgi:hypothetical protein
MNGWSPLDAIAMERRHVIEGEEIVARQEALVSKLRGKGHDQRLRLSIEMLGTFRECLELSRERLWDLE